MPRPQGGRVTSFRIIIKADQGGPAEALADALAQLSTTKAGNGATAGRRITESDILRPSAPAAIVLGFHVRPDSNARTACGVGTGGRSPLPHHLRSRRRCAERALEDAQAEERETCWRGAKYSNCSRLSKVGTIAGCMVRSGTIQRTGKARWCGTVPAVYTGTLSSLKRFKDDVKEVREGLDVGLAIENFTISGGDRNRVIPMEDISGRWRRRR